MPVIDIAMTTGPEAPPEEPDTVEFVGDLDEIVESTMCSCNAGDDQPY